jgi:hypothetical protein
LDHNERRKKIIDFLVNNQGCNIEKLVKGVAKYVSRKPVFSILDELKEEGVVIDKKDENKPNKRDHALYLVTTNLLVSVPKELDEFKSHYLVLVKDVMKKVKEKETKKEDACDLLTAVIDIFHMLTDAYLFRSTINWPRIIHDVETLNRLNTSMLTKIVEIQSELYKILSPSLGVLKTYDMFSNISGARIIKYNSTFRKFDIENEISQVMGEIGLEKLYGNPDRGVLPS